jgi:hypothetical protein
MSLQQELIQDLRALASDLYDNDRLNDANTLLRAITEIERLNKLAYAPSTYLPTRGS